MKSSIVLASLAVLSFIAFPAVASGPRTNVAVYSDPGCLLSNGAARPESLAGAVETGRANGCVSLKVGDKTVYVLESALLAVPRAERDCEPKPGGGPKSPVSAAQSAGAGSGRGKCP